MDEPLRTASNRSLIERAATVVRPRKVGPYLVGDVGCALQAASGEIYLGVCLDLPSGMGFCAEHAAMAAALAAGETRVRRIVAVWRDDDGQGDTYVLAPCGRCREFLRQIQDGDLTTEVVLGADETATLADLLPHPGRFQRVDPPT